MQLSLLQLNMNADNYWDSLIPFLTSHDFDIIQLQEVTGKDTIEIYGTNHSQRDCFQDLRAVLGERYNGELAITDRFTSSPEAYDGVAIFYKKQFALQKKHMLWLNKRETPFPSDSTDFTSHGRALLHLTLATEGKRFSILNTHFAWAKTPQQEPHQTRQGDILLDYVRSVPHPFIVSGDFNLSPDQPLITSLSELSRNLITENNITNTLNSRTHRVKELFPPGVAVDYIFVSKDVAVKDFQVLDTEDISDHFGLRATFEM